MTGSLEICVLTPRCCCPANVSSLQFSGLESCPEFYLVLRKFEARPLDILLTWQSSSQWPWACNLHIELQSCVIFLWFYLLSLLTRDVIYILNETLLWFRGRKKNERDRINGNHIYFRKISVAQLLDTYNCGVFRAFRTKRLISNVWNID